MKVAGKIILKKAGYKFLWVLGILFCLRLFFFDIYKIPSDSMKNKFKPDDYIFINKTCYSGVFSLLLNNLNITRTPRLNEIFVFKIKKQTSRFFVKRCIGLPGSAIEIKNGVVNVNGKAITEPLTIMHYYKIWFNDFQEVKADIEAANIDKMESRYRKFPKYIFLALDNFQKERLKRGIDSITLYKTYHDPDSLKINLTALTENNFDMPLLIIPWKGMKIFSNQQYSPVYEKAIKSYEDTSFHQAEGYFYLQGKKVDSYTFKRDYFFMLGDNRDIAIDSRRYGLIPRENLIGKYMFCL